jgi:tetratricopeptide (TPR) repeat protein
VIEKGDAAVIFFGAREGWDNAPFLFCRTREGWQCDIVHQRKYIRMGKDPAWGVERGDHPYIGLLEKCPYFQGQDIPLEAPDVYRIVEDGSMAERILAAEARLQEAPADPAALMELGRLYTIVSMGQKALPLLKKAKTVDPAAALPYKYLAILHVDMFYQYEQAIQELTEYVARRPEDVFGRNYLGYLHYQMRRYPEAVDQLQKALALRADNCYALCLLSRAYGQMALAAWRIDPRRPWYRKSSLEMFQKAASVETPNPRRVAWLQDWLKRHKILVQGG